MGNVQKSRRGYQHTSTYLVAAAGGRVYTNND
jgi:hypothetical protein